MHNLCLFYTFSTFAQKIFREWGCNFTWSFGKVIHSKSVKMVFVTSIIRHKLWIIYAFFDFFCSTIIFDQKLFSYYCDKFDYSRSIVYLSCFVWLIHFKTICPIRDDLFFLIYLLLMPSLYKYFVGADLLEQTFHNWCWHIFQI